MFSMVQRQAHPMRRRIFANIYSKSSLHSSDVIRDLCQASFIERLLPIVDSAARDSTPVNMLDYSSALFSDFTTAFVFGLQGGSNFVQDDNARADWVAAKTLSLATPAWGVEFPPFISSILNRLNITLATPQTNPGTEQIKFMYLDMLKKAEKFSESPETSQAEGKKEKWTEPVVYKQFLSQLRSSAEKAQTGADLQLTIASELMDHLVSGTETTAWTLAYAMHELSQSPSLQSSLRQELLSLLPPLHYPQEDPNSTHATKEAQPSPRDLASLPLLNALIYKTLRLHSPVSGPQPRLTPSHPVAIPLFPNIAIPPRTRISANAYTLHHDAAVFHSPETFNPYRWLAPKDSSRSRVEFLIDVLPKVMNVTKETRDEEIREVMKREYGYEISLGVCEKTKAAVLGEKVDEDVRIGEKEEEGKGGKEEMRKWFWAFGSGANGCLGEELALLGEFAFVCLLSF